MVKNLLFREDLTPRMLRALAALVAGNSLDSTHPDATTGSVGHCIGRPSKQRLAKYGLATFDNPRDWDGPMHITPRGLIAWDQWGRS